MNYLVKFKLIFIALIYSLFFLLSECLYRIYFDIPTVRSLLETYIFIFVFSLLILTVKSRISVFFIWLFFALSIIVNNIHYEFYRSWINATNYLLAITEASEVTHAGMSMIPKLFIPFTWGLIEILVFTSLIFFRKKKFFVADLIFIISFAFICVRSFSTTQQHAISPNPDYCRLKVNYFTLGYFIGKTLPYHFFDLSNVEPYQRETPNVISKPEVKNIIFLVGESQNTQNMSYFGYTRETTPFLNKFAKEYNPTIKATYSAGVMTAIALPTLFNAVERPNGLVQITSGKTNLFNLAQKQGFFTQFHSTQAEREMMIINIIGSKWIDDLTFPTDLGYSRFEHIRDDNLLQYLYQSDLDGKSNFLILHQRGSHVPYGENLDITEKRFGDKTIVDNYDNTILHTDHILDEIFQYLNKRGKDDWILIFTSDHGQQVSNNTFNQGKLNTSSYSVPVVIYTPIESLQNEINQKFKDCNHMFHQQLSTLIISLMGYDMPISECKKGVVNSNLLTGDNGYLEIDQEIGSNTFVFPNGEK